MSFHPSRLFFLNESGFGVSDCTRAYGWGRGRIHIVHRYQRQPQRNVVLVIGYYGVLISVLVPTTNTDTFLDVINTHILPLLPSHSMLIMDNHPVHRRALVVDAISQAFAPHSIGLGFLPPYSPDLNPIECLFGQVKAYIKEEGLFEEDPLGSISRAFARITVQQCNGWYKHCGYE